ncbi:hypothetical protein KAR91_31335 [Candidatus Pacearchaeota archaeon]|nr:hypothetical protein [Candidatus Pacearchaeota archaeon]
MILKVITMKDQNRANNKTSSETKKPDYVVHSTSWYEAQHILHKWLKIPGKPGMQHQFEINGTILCIDDNIEGAETIRHIYLCEKGKTIDSY